MRFHQHKKIIKKYWEKVYALKFDNLNNMDKVLERHNQPKFIQEEISKLNRPISIKEIKLNQ